MILTKLGERLQNKVRYVQCTLNVAIGIRWLQGVLMLRNVPLKHRDISPRLKFGVFAVCFCTYSLVVACAADQSAGARRKARTINDLKLASGQVTRVEIDKLDDGRVYFRYETKHGSSSCDELNEVRELWTVHVLTQPEAADATAIMLDPTDPSGTSRTYRYVRQGTVWEERFSSKCNG